MLSSTTLQAPKSEPKPEELFLKSLKEETALLHQQLETSPLSMNLMSAEVSLQQYAAYLAAMKGVIEFTEAQLFPIVSKLIADKEERRKLISISEDLKALSSQVTIPSYPAFTPFQLPVSPAFAIGVIYVVEGSTLGGRVILKHLQQRLFNLSDGTSFFTGYGEHTGRLWKSFLNAFSGYAVQTNSQKEISEGAQQAFRSIYNYFVSLPGIK